MHILWDNQRGKEEGMSFKLKEAVFKVRCRAPGCPFFSDFIVTENIMGLTEADVDSEAQKLARNMAYNKHDALYGRMHALESPEIHKISGSYEAHWPSASGPVTNAPGFHPLDATPGAGPGGSAPGSSDGCPSCPGTRPDSPADAAITRGPFGLGSAKAPRPGKAGARGRRKEGPCREKGCPQGKEGGAQSREEGGAQGGKEEPQAQSHKEGRKEERTQGSQEGAKARGG